MSCVAICQICFVTVSVQWHQFFIYFFAFASNKTHGSFSNTLQFFSSYTIKLFLLTKKLQMLLRGPSVDFECDVRRWICQLLFFWYVCVCLFPFTTSPLADLESSVQLAGDEEKESVTTLNLSSNAIKSDTCWLILNHWFTTSSLPEKVKSL